MLKVANVIEEGRLGGPQVRIMRVAAALKGRVNMTVIMPKENSELFRSHCDKLGVSYKTFLITRITRQWKAALRYFMFSLWEIVQLVRYLRNEDFDLVHVSGGSWQYKGIVAGKLAGRKVLWHLNDTYMPWVFRKIFAFLSPLADGYVYSAERSRDYYSSLVKKDKPEFVISPPVDTTWFDSAKQYSGDEDIIKRWHGKSVIGTVANINPIKGLDVFIRAAAALNDHSDKQVFVVVGPTFKNQCQYFERLQRLCDRLSVDNVEFVGGRSDVRPLLKRFDVFVCSSVSETGPMTLFEAMSMEKPVVSTDVGDVANFIKDGESGFVVSIKDAVALAERVGLLIENTDLRKKVGANARKIAIKNLDIDICVKKHAEFYKKIINKH